MSSPARLLALCLCWLATAPAWAHSLSVAHLDVAVPADGQATVELDLAIRDLALTLPLDADRDDTITWRELQAAHDAIDALVVADLSLDTSAGACTLGPSGLAVRRYDDGAYAALRMPARCPRAADLRVDYGLFFDRDPRHRALVSLRRGDAVATGIARAGARKLAFGQPGTDAGKGFAGFLREGVHHILVGYDHLAFLLSLLLPAALMRSGGAWRPAPNLRDTLGRVVGTVSAFTLAHSVTLSLSALDWVAPASRWVEAAIAASVVLAALNNLWPVVTRRIWLVAFAFGLVHGFGFAGALGELGLPREARLASLLGFNLGVELGQLAVVAALLPLLFLLRRPAWYARVAMPLGSLAIAGVAGNWLLERLGG